MKMDIRKFYQCVDKRLLAQRLVPFLNKNFGKGHTWQCDDNGNIYILYGMFVIMKL